MTLPLQHIAFSMLDLVPVREGHSVADALAVSLRTARHAEQLGFARYWLAEHHNLGGIASSATARPKIAIALNRYVMDRPNAGCSPLAAKKCW